MHKSSVLRGLCTICAPCATHSHQSSFVFSSLFSPVHDYDRQPIEPELRSDYVTAQICCRCCMYQSEEMRSLELWCVCRTARVTHDALHASCERLVS